MTRYRHLYLLVLITITMGMAGHGQMESVAAEHPLRISEPVEEIAADIKGFIPEYLREHRIPGAAIALIQDGEIAWTAGFGVANALTRRPVTPDHLFEVASNTKVVTAYTALRLVDQGILSLDRPLNAYLSDPWLPPSQYRDRITLRHVLSHSAGFGRNIGSRQSHFAPGTRYSYSSIGLAYAQAVIEALTGEPLEQVSHQLVFVPLGMPSSSLVNSDDLSLRTANGHVHAVLPTLLFLIVYAIVSVPTAAIALAVLRIRKGTWRPEWRVAAYTLAVSLVLSILSVFTLLSLAGLSEFAWMVLFCGAALAVIFVAALYVGRMIGARLGAKMRGWRIALATFWYVLILVGVASLTANLPNLPVPRWTAVRADGGGSMRATVGDLASLLIELSDPQILDEGTAAQLRTSQVKASDDLSWGLGPGIYHGAQGDALWQWGQHVDFQSVMMIYRQRGFGVVVCTNSDLLKPDVALEIAHRAVGGRIEPIRRAIHLQYNYRSDEDGEMIGERFTYHGEPAFTIEFPGGATRTDTDAPNQVFAARTPEGVVFQVAVADIPKGQTLGRAAEGYANGLSTSGIGTGVEITSNREITLQDGTKGYRSEIVWTYAPTQVRLNTQMVSAYSDGKMVYVTAHPEESPERVIPIVESLSFHE